MCLPLCVISETEEKAKREQEEQEEATAENQEHKKDPELSGPKKDQRVGEDDPEPGGVNKPSEESPHDKSKKEEAHGKLQNGIVLK